MLGSATCGDMQLRVCEGTERQLSRLVREGERSEKGKAQKRSRGKKAVN